MDILFKNFNFFRKKEKISKEEMEKWNKNDKRNNKKIKKKYGNVLY